MTTQIFFENQTNISFDIYDTDENHYGVCSSGQRNSLTLPYSETSQKQYNLVSINGSLLFNLNINGELSNTNTNSGIAQLRITQIKNQHLPINVTKNVIGDLFTMQKLTKKVWSPNNTLLIIFPNQLPNPIKNFPGLKVFYNQTLPIF